MNNENRSIEEQAEMLAEVKMQKHREERSKSKSEDHLRPLSDIGVYEVLLPLPEQKDYLKTHMFSFKTPTGQDWLDITPIDAIKSVANDFKNKHGIDVSDEEFNSYQKVRTNPDLLTSRRLSKEEAKDLFKSWSNRRLKRGEV